MAHPWLAAGGALPPLQQEQGPANGSAAAAGAAEEWQEQGQEEEQTQQLLTASLQGLVAGGLQVQTFAAGEQLMTRGQQGMSPACWLAPRAFPPDCLTCVLASVHVCCAAQNNLSMCCCQLLLMTCLDC